MRKGRPGQPSLGDEEEELLVREVEGGSRRKGENKRRTGEAREKKGGERGGEIRKRRKSGKTRKRGKRKRGKRAGRTGGGASTRRSKKRTGIRRKKGKEEGGRGCPMIMAACEDLRSGKGSRYHCVGDSFTPPLLN